MPHSKLDDLPNGGDRWRAIGREGFKTIQWGDMEVGLTSAHGHLDCSDAYQFRDPPGGVCPCPHYGYISEGRLRAKYPGSNRPDEVIGAGEACSIPSGHVLIYEEPSRILQLNPAHVLKMCMDTMQEALTKNPLEIPSPGG